MTSTGNGDHIDRDMIGRIVVTKMESKDRGFAVCGSDRGRRVVHAHPRLRQSAQTFAAPSASRIVTDAVAARRRGSLARFSQREPSRYVARIDHRHVGDRVVRSGEERLAAQDGAGERSQLAGICGWLPRHVFDRSAGV
jgi:hypothetical protein